MNVKNCIHLSNQCSLKIFIFKVVRLLSSSIGFIGATADGKTEGRRRQRRRRMQLLGDFREKINYWNLKAEALDRTLWRNSFDRGCGPFARETAKYIKE
jgi:hypothetical protein